VCNRPDCLRGALDPDYQFTLSRSLTHVTYQRDYQSCNNRYCDPGRPVLDIERRKVILGSPRWKTWKQRRIKMKNKLFGIDIMCFLGKTTVDFWRRDKECDTGVRVHSYKIKNLADYDRLNCVLPPQNVSFVYIHPQPDSLSISWSLKE
jgi:hypothetical protein